MATVTDEETLQVNHSNVRSPSPAADALSLLEDMDDLHIDSRDSNSEETLPLAMTSTPQTSSVQSRNGLDHFSDGGDESSVSTVLNRSDSPGTNRSRGSIGSSAPNERDSCSFTSSGTQTLDAPGGLKTSVVGYEIMEPRNKFTVSLFLYFPPPPILVE